MTLFKMYKIKYSSAFMFVVLDAIKTVNINVPKMIIYSMPASFKLLPALFNFSVNKNDVLWQFCNLLLFDIYYAFLVQNVYEIFILSQSGSLFFCNGCLTMGCLLLYESILVGL